LPIIGKLGHSKTTERRAHLAIDLVQRAADEISAQITAAKAVFFAKWFFEPIR
jgi:hypothetical protein